MKRKPKNIFVEKLNNLVVNKINDLENFPIVFFYTDYIFSDIDFLYLNKLLSGPPKIIKLFTLSDNLKPLFEKINCLKIAEIIITDEDLNSKVLTSVDSFVRSVNPLAKVNFFIRDTFKNHIEFNNYLSNKNACCKFFTESYLNNFILYNDYYNNIHIDKYNNISLYKDFKDKNNLSNINIIDFFNER